MKPNARGVLFQSETSQDCEHFAITDNEEVQEHQGTRKSSDAHAQS